MIAVFFQPAQVPLQLFRRHHHWVVAGRSIGHIMVHQDRQRTSPFQLRGILREHKNTADHNAQHQCQRKNAVQHRSFLLSPLGGACQIPPSIIIKSVLSEKRNQIFKKVRLTEEYSRDWKEKILCTGEKFLDSMHLSSMQRQIYFLLVTSTVSWYHKTKLGTPEGGRRHDGSQDPSWYF